MESKRFAEFDQLVGGYYGTGVPMPDPRRGVQDLLSTYYGKPATRPARGVPTPSVSLSLGCDDGEVLPQREKSAPAANGSAAALDFEEYVIEVASPSAPDMPDAPATPAPPPAPSPPPPAPEPRAMPDPEPASAPLSHDEADIMSEIQSIISAGKNYNRQAAEAPARNGGDRTPYADGHAIFDRIAQSMQHANAYDLGTVDLENRFAAFDRHEDQKRRAPTGTAATPAKPAHPPVPTSDFMADLDAITARPTPPPMSRPLYDTGEHVMAGNGLYAERLRAGKGASVPLSYGQIIAMCDLYATVDDLFDADPAELNRLKTLIVRSTAFYEGKRGNSALDVSNEEWDAATGGRYLKLADGNYEHFSPPTVAMGAGQKTVHGNNRQQWEYYHRRAIEDAQQEYLRSSATTSPFFERALVINAFGDHFLTDAFSAGHLINKEVLIARYKSAFYKGNDLSDAGKKFFESVADKAWVGDVAARFSKLETYDRPVIWGFLPLPWHPNIDSASRFATVLKEAAKQQPDRVGNLIVKALHDYLNEHGIEVTNGAGDGTWVLPGDGTLAVGTGALTPADLAKNLTIMRRAVQQSIDQVNSPAIRVSNLQYQPLFDAVWRNVPHLTPASQGQMTALIADYSNSGSATLVQAAARIVTEQLQAFIKLLIQEHKLRPA
jgi:hypothetical protein